MTEPEFDLVKYTLEEARCFLVKQGNRSVMAKLDLNPKRDKNGKPIHGMPDMDDELAVLSSNKRTVPLVRQLIDHYGNDPKIWLPVFHRERKLLK